MVIPREYKYQQKIQNGKFRKTKIKTEEKIKNKIKQ